MLNLIPYPSGMVQEKQEICRIPGVISADLGGFARWAVIAFEKRMGTGLVEGGSWLRLFRDSGKPQEGYSLGITPDGVSIGAADEQGVIWALTTLALLAEDGVLPCCLIQDAPRYAHRGLSLDCARHFFPAEEVKKVIEEIALKKMNVLHWHLSDDQGWRVESKRFPQLTKGSRQFYTQTQIRDVVEFARLRGVEVIPEIDLPGHTMAILHAFPEFGCFGRPVPLAKTAGVYPEILCPGKDDLFDFLASLLEEIASLFPSHRFHIGGDEAPKSAWKQCPDCAARMEILGYKDYEDLQGWFTRCAGGILERLGKTPICWDDTLLASNAPEEIQAQYWHLDHAQAVADFARRGGKWIYSDKLDFYLDYPYSMTPMKKVYSAVPQLGKRNAEEIPGLLGLECCLWTEHIITPERLETRLFPRIYAFAEICWGRAGDYGAFQARVEAAMKAPLHSGIAYTDRSWWDPNGSPRRKEALGYLRAQKAAMESDEGSKRSKEYTLAFVKKFFRPSDMPFLWKPMKKK